MGDNQEQGNGQQREAASVNWDAITNDPVFSDHTFEQKDEEAEMKQYFIPALGISKKDGSIKLVIDFQTHTELIERRVYSLPRIE